MEKELILLPKHTNPQTNHPTKRTNNSFVDFKPSGNFDPMGVESR